MCVNELPRHLRVAAGPVDQGQVEGDLPPQVHLVLLDPLPETKTTTLKMLVLRLQLLPAGTEHRVGAGIAVAIGEKVQLAGRNFRRRSVTVVHLQLVRGQLQGLLVVVDSQVGQAQLVQGSAQVVDALLTLAAQLHVAPQEGETLGSGKQSGRRRGQVERLCCGGAGGLPAG